jgi:hypothetical protein
VRPRGDSGSVGCGAGRSANNAAISGRSHGARGARESLHELGDLQASGVEVLLQCALRLAPLGLTDA